VKTVLREEQEELPLTARQIFYMMVGRFQFQKTEQAYGRLCNLMVKARRAQMLPFTSIRDDKGTSIGGDWGYDSPLEFWEAQRDRHEYYGRATREGQEYRIELWCETEGIVPMLGRAAEPYGVKVTGTGGFPGVTSNHRMAKRIIAHDLPTVFLHLGDYDPSGESIYDTMRDDVFAFIAGELGLEEARKRFIPRRIGLTEEQIEEHGIETAPPKKSDGRSRRWEEEGRLDSAQLEAVPTTLLRGWVADACEEFTDMELVQQVAEKADEEREQIADQLGAAIDRIINEGGWE
jgi:hypothetical protein